MDNGPLVLFFKPATSPGLRTDRGGNTVACCGPSQLRSSLAPPGSLPGDLRGLWASAAAASGRATLPQHTGICRDGREGRGQIARCRAGSGGGTPGTLPEDRWDQPLAGLGRTLHGKSIWASFPSLSMPDWPMGSETVHQGPCPLLQSNDGVLFARQ